MPEFLEGLFRTDFLPHGWCYRWNPEIVWLHVVSDLLIALAYYFIPFALIYIVRRRGDLVYPWMFWLFGTFILACGTTHLMSVIVVWQPWYRLDGAIKLLTAFASVPTAMLLMRVAPAVIALPSPEQLRQVNRQLAQEVQDRKAAEEEVRMLNADLERRVQERTKELERANAKLRESENRMRAILESTPLLVYMKDYDDKYLFVNSEFEEAFRKRREEVIGRYGHELFPADLAEAYRRADLEVWSDRSPHEFEEHAYQGGATHTYMSVKFPLFGEDGQPYALCGMSADITDRKRAEQELQRYNMELEQFAFVAAHDLQEPLRTVKTYVQLLWRRHPSLAADHEGREYMNYVTGAVDRMYALVGGLQSYLETASDKKDAERANATDVLEETLRTMNATIHESGAEVSFDKLPDAAISPAHLGQIFQNLISNAIKYRKPGQTPKIDITARRNGREQEFCVKDFGIGMEMKYAQQIFGVFKRLHGRDVPGTGIGLAIVKKIIESNGGRVWVRSSPGEGAEFRFTLPAVD